MNISFLRREKRGIIRLPAAIMIFIISFSVSISCGASEMAGPAGVIKKFNAALLEAMKKADELGFTGRYKLLEPAIKNTFALSFMAGQSPGRYWKTLTAGERDTLVRTYTDWTIATYAGRFDGYSGERFDIVSESGPVQGTVTVISRLVKQNGEEVGFHYLLRKVEGTWRVVDIQISGVSQLALTRAQFTAVMKDKGFNGLIAMLGEKIKGFGKAGGK